MQEGKGLNIFDFTQRTAPKIYFNAKQPSFMLESWVIFTAQNKKKNPEIKVLKSQLKE